MDSLEGSREAEGMRHQPLLDSRGSHHAPNQSMGQDAHLQCLPYHSRRCLADCGLAPLLGQKHPAFYATLGGQQVSEKESTIGAAPLIEAAYDWPDLHEPVQRLRFSDTLGRDKGSKTVAQQWKAAMESPSSTTNTGTVLAPSDDLLYEVVDGQVVELAPMGAYEIRIASILLMYLETFARQHLLGRAVQEMLFDLSATVQRKRRPDVAFVSYERWPRQCRVPRTEAWEVVPNLVVEVVSPTDRVDDVVDKVAEYFRAGVECVWVSLPSREQVYVYESPTQVRILTSTDVLYGEPVLPQFRLPLTALFDEVEGTEAPRPTD